VDVEDGGHCYGLVLNYMGWLGAAYRRGAGDATFVAARRNASPASPVLWRDATLVWRKLMPPRDDELPEGTDHIINGAMETGGDTSGGGGGASSGFIGASGGDGTGGTAAAGGTKMTATEESGGGVTEQLRGQVSNLREQAGGKVRGFAEDGKTRASDVLEELSRVVADTADSIDERLGNNYGEYARRAADSVSGLAENLRSKDVDELYDNVRSAVRKSPGVAIGIAAVVGFTLVRLIKAGMTDDGSEGGAGRRGRTKSGGSGA
jgi:ElaB/YqjD/DUF883 family membrane-anchored ribosome-binding protein